LSDLEDNPFWNEPPYILLTDVLQLDKIEPWNVDVGKLVAGFLQEMKRLGEIDFRVSGNALYSASVIFMRKTKELVELGVLPPEQLPDADAELIVPMIRPPFRLVNRQVTLEELLVAMDKVLSKGFRERDMSSGKKYRTQIDSLEFRVETERANVEENISEVYEDLRRIMETGDSTAFTDILVNNTRKEVVRVLFAILHLYARVFIDILVDDDMVIWIKLLEPPEDYEYKPATMQSSLEE
jgi:segregation and condensation protein A